MRLPRKELLRTLVTGAGIARHSIQVGVLLGSISCWACRHIDSMTDKVKAQPLRFLASA